MKIVASRMYKVMRYAYKGEDIVTSDCGLLQGSDVKPMLRGYKYDEVHEMWFSRSARVAYDVVEAE